MDSTKYLLTLIHALWLKKYSLTRTINNSRFFLMPKNYNPIDPLLYAHQRLRLEKVHLQPRALGYQ